MLSLGRKEKGIKDMIDLTKFKDISSKKFIVRHTEDDSGDHTLHEYAIVAVMPWGTRTICDCIDNPHDAEMFALAPSMIQEIIELREKVEKLEACISMASAKLMGENAQPANEPDRQPSSTLGSKEVSGN